MKESYQAIPWGENNFGRTNNFGLELYNKAQEIFERDQKDKAAKYYLQESEWEFLAKTLQQFGFRKFVDNAIGKPLFLIHPQKLKLLEMENYGSFLTLPIFDPPKEVTIGNNIKKLKDLGEIEALKLNLKTEVIPDQEDIICQYQQLALIVHSYRNYFFLQENLKVKIDFKKVKNLSMELMEIKRANVREIRIFQKILKQIFQKSA